MGSAPYRVLHLIRSCDRRGAELFAARLAIYLQGEVLENAICSLYSSPHDPGTVFPPAIRVFAMNGHRKQLGMMAGFGVHIIHRFSKVLMNFQPDLVIGHGSDTLKYTALTKLLSRKTRTIYKNIGTASTWANSAAKVNFNKLLLRGIDTVVSVSQYTRHDFIRLYRLPRERVTFISNGLDISEFEPCRYCRAH